MKIVLYLSSENLLSRFRRMIAQLENIQTLIVSETFSDFLYDTEGTRPDLAIVEIDSLTQGQLNIVSWLISRLHHTDFIAVTDRPQARHNNVYHSIGFAHILDHPVSLEDLTESILL